MATKTYEISDSQWRVIKDMLPPERTGKPGRPCETSNRDVLNGVLWIAHTGSQWKELPAEYGKKSTLFGRFKGWKDKGILESIFLELSKDCDMQDLSLDSTSSKVHQHAAGAKRGPDEKEVTADEMKKKQDIGLSRGGNNTKIHALVDGLGNPIRLLFTSGEASDCNWGVPLLQGFPLSESSVLGDKAYGTVEILAYIRENGGTVVIPPKSNTVNPWDCDYHHYKERHLVECFFNKLKHFRRIATRYEKLSTMFQAFVYLAAVMIWLM